jgi:hypothetical protein
MTLGALVEFAAIDKRKNYETLKARDLTKREWLLEKGYEDEMRSSTSRKVGDFRTTQREST